MKNLKKILKTKSYKRVEVFALIFILLFALFGIFVFSIVVHEYSHRFDYLNLEGKSNQEICALVLPAEKGDIFNYSMPIGYYKFSFNDKNKTLEDAYTSIHSKTEFKAQVVEYIFLGFAILLFLIVMNFAVKWSICGNDFEDLIDLIESVDLNNLNST